MKALVSKKALLIYILIAAFILRLILSPYYTHNYDMGTWIYWAKQLVELGFTDYFHRISWSDYLPSYFYVLYIVEKINQFLGTDSLLTYKLPAILSDLGSGILIYLISEKLEFRRRIGLVAAYLFNPAIFANSAMWGQVDGIGAFLVLLTLYLFLKQRIILLGLIIAITLLFKPLYLLLVPLFLVAQFRKNLKQIPLLLLSIIFYSLLITLPFSKNYTDTPSLIYERYSSSLGQYHYATVNGFNFWAMTGNNWVSDDNLLWGQSLHTWGLFIFAVLFAGVLLNLLLQKVNDQKYHTTLIFSVALTFLYIYNFPTRVHERHMLTALPFVLLLSPYSKIFTLSYLILSIVYITNLYFGIEYLYQNGKFIFDDMTVRTISALPVFISLLLLFELIYSLYKKLPEVKNAFK